MVLIALILASVGIAFYLGHRRDHFDPMYFISALIIFMLLSVVALGLMASHNKEETRVLSVIQVIELNRGYAVQTSMDDGIYLSKQVTTLSYDCERPKLIETVSKTYPYLLGVGIITDSQNVLCLTDDDALPQG